VKESSHHQCRAARAETAWCQRAAKKPLLCKKKTENSAKSTWIGHQNTGVNLAPL